MRLYLGFFVLSISLSIPSLLFAGDRDCRSLHDAVRNNNILELTRILGLIDPDCQDELGQTALHVYAKQPAKDQWMFVIMYYHGLISLNKTSHDGTTPLMTAILHENKQAIELFLVFNRPENPVGINEQNSLGYTALHMAALKNNAQLINSLLLSGARPDIKEGLGLTASELAKSSGSLMALTAFNDYLSKTR